MTEEELRKAREYFEQAIQISPDYAPPYAGLADYYAESYELPSGVQLQKARQYAEKALALDDTLAEAHLSLGNVDYHEWHWTEAQQQFTRTLQLNPSYADAHRRYSMYLSALGRKEEAWAEIQTARELDPFSVSILGSMGWVAYFARDYDQAIQQCAKVAEVSPNNVDAYECMGLSYMAKGNYDQAAKECQKAMTLSGADPDRMVCLGQAYAAAGRAADARRLLQEMYQASQKRNVPPYFFALMHGALDEKEKAFEWLGKSYQERDPYLVWLKVSPAADSLRADPRFDWFVKQAGSVQ
jgi:tetratricopeptide (TPR) repeat protein